MEVIKAILSSKKAVTALVSVAAGLVGKLGLDLEPQEIMAILSPAMAYIAGQSVADIGKEKAKVQKNSG